MESETPKRSKSTLPPLPTWELAIYFSIWIGHIVYAWIVVWQASIQHADRLYAGFFEPGWRLLNYRRRDVANYEWNSWLPSLPTELSVFLLHLITLRLLDRVIEEKWKLQSALVPCWLIGLWMKLGWTGVTVTLLYASIMLAVARLTQWKLAVWLCACCLLGTLITDWYQFKGDWELAYRFSVYVAYKLLHFISFCIHDIDAKRGKEKAEDGEKGVVYQPGFFSAYYSLIGYTLYPPYAASLIITYQDYVHQWTNRRSITPDYRRIAIMIARVAFWTTVNDLILHFAHTNAMLMDKYFLAEVDLVTLAAIGYTAGQYFQMKYVSIFGLNTVFALLDGMTPPDWPPICITRVALYSNMWRYFDRGLYSFLRDHIFLPLAKPTFSIWRRLFASFVCFSFIWLWHGMTWTLFYWVAMNFIEVTLENVAKQVYKLPSVHTWIQTTFSPLNLRRIRAMCQVVCIFLGVFSIFFFLGGNGVGNVFVQRLIIGKGVYLNFPFIYLLILAYCHAHCCMEVEAKVGPM